MPTNKNALYRYQLIDRCLSNRNRKWTWEDILKYVNQELMANGNEPISKTTIFEDLKDIEYRVYDGELEKIKGDLPRSKYIRYKDPNYCINKRPMSDAEAGMIKDALQVLTRLKGLPQFEWTHEIIATLQSKLGFVADAENIISFDHNEDYEGLQYISPFFNAIQHRRVLMVTYKDFKSLVPYDLEFHPYHLKQYQSRWFVFGKSPSFPQYSIMNLALDRVITTEETSTPLIPTEINWNDYFSDIIGVTKKEAEPVDVKILIKDEEQAAYIRTKPIHASQKQIKKVENGFQTSIKVIPNYELLKTLLSFGNRIYVIEPIELTNTLNSLK